MTFASIVAAASPSPTAPAVDPDRVNAGVYGFAFLLFLIVAVFIIWKSMNTQLRRVTFDEDSTLGAPSAQPLAPDDGQPAGTDPASTSAD